MSKKLQPGANPETSKAPDAVQEINHLQDEFAGQGGSYVIDPLTNKRVKNTGDVENG